LDLNVMDAGAVTAVTNAKTAGFPTFVVGIGNTMGDAGNSFITTSTARPTSSPRSIRSSGASCTISLTGVDGTLDKVAVSAKDPSGNTVEIMQDPANGWSYTDASMTTIVLNGTACTDLQDGTYSDFQFIYTCSTGMICIDRKSDGTCGTSG
jgi:hypothetical protein